MEGEGGGSVEGAGDRNKGYGCGRRQVGKALNLRQKQYSGRNRQPTIQLDAGSAYANLPWVLAHYTCGS